MEKKREGSTGFTFRGKKKRGGEGRITEVMKEESSRAQRDLHREKGRGGNSGAALEGRGEGSSSLPT